MKSDRLHRVKNDTDRTDQTDETNQTDENNQIDEDELELIKAKLSLSDLKPLRPLIPIDLSTSRPPDTTRVKDIPKIQKNKKLAYEKIENTLNSIKRNSKELE